MKDVDSHDRWFIGRTGLEVVQDLSWDEYQRVGAFIRQRRESSTWALADWVAYGIRVFEPHGVQYQHLSNVTGYSASYLMNMHAVGMAYPPGKRWLGVTVGAHREALRLVEGLLREQVLTEASRRRWTQAEVRQEIDRIGALNPKALHRNRKVRPFRNPAYTPVHVQCPECGHQFPPKAHRVRSKGLGVA